MGETVVLVSFPEVLHAVVISGGGAIDPRVLPRLPTGAMVIAADSGYESAVAIGITPDLIVGDFDSISEESLKGAQELGIEMQQHLVEKDSTDLELAIDASIAAGAGQVTVVGPGGGRLDHFMAEILLLASDTYREIMICGYFGEGLATLVRHDVVLDGELGAIVSLLAIGGVASGIHTSGLRYALNGEDLHPGSTRGVSNVFEEASASISVSSGALLALQPHALE